jgi:hypothetical protein
MRFYKDSEMKDAITAYQEIRHLLDTFTAVNCIPKGFILSKVGHTAVLVKSPQTGQISVLESTSLNKFTGISGVQMTPFGLWLKNYPGKVYVRIPSFQGSTDTLLNPDFNRQLLAEAFIRNHLGTSYPDLKTWGGRLKLAFSALDFKLFGRDWITYKGGDKGIFCTMLFIMLLQYCGLFDVDENPQEYEPDDTRGGVLEFFEQNLKHVTYGKEIRLK